MEIDLLVTLTGLVAGVVVGLTGMGGGALMTPILVLGFGVPPVIAVSSDVMASVGMKVVGAGVHMRGGTVHRGVVKFLVLGSVPSALVGAYVLRQLDQAGLASRWLMPVLGATLLIASLAMFARARLKHRRGPVEAVAGEAPVRPIQTLGIGIVGGLVVGMTSVGSGSLMLVLLMLLYPTLSASRLVGTDLTQALPLVLAAAVGHLAFGSVDWALTGAILLGGLPGIYLGARFSSKAPDHVVRPLLIALLGTLGLKLLQVPLLILVPLALGLCVALAVYWRNRARVAIAPAE